MNVEAHNMTTAILYDHHLPVLFDTGAQMTVVPEELVPPIAYTGAKVQLRGFDGSMREVDTAWVKLRFGEME